MGRYGNRSLIPPYRVGAPREDSVVGAGIAFGLGTGEKERHTLGYISSMVPPLIDLIETLEKMGIGCSSYSHLPHGGNEPRPSMEDLV